MEVMEDAVMESRWRLQTCRNIMMKVMEDAMMESRCLQASDGGNSAGKML